jgi:uncharacterized membrane protein
MDVEPKHRQRKLSRVVQVIEAHVLRRMLAGFIVILPLGVTVFLIVAVQGFLDKWIRPRVDGTWVDFPGIGVVIIVLACYLIGLLVAWRLGRVAVDWQKLILSRIPVFKSIYSIVSQATEAFASPTGRKFNRVVFIEWPRPGVWSMGFVTGFLPPDESGKSKVVVFIPQSPTPTTGNLAFVMEEDVVDARISVDAAMRAIVSAGIVLPAQPREGREVPPASRHH